uniref:Uncharacterized protein n=1 Tax=Arundo donax TaxID=35708 RepID=A0A0A9DCD3_ARUDO
MCIGPSQMCMYWTRICIANQFITLFYTCMSPVNSKYVPLFALKCNLLIFGRPHELHLSVNMDKELSKVDGI